MRGFKSKAQRDFFERESATRGGAFKALAQQKALDTADPDALPDRAAPRVPVRKSGLTRAGRPKYYGG